MGGRGGRGAGGGSFTWFGRLAVLLGNGLIDHQGAPHQTTALHTTDGLERFIMITHHHNGETTWFSSLFVGRHGDVFQFTKRLKEPPNSELSHLVIKVANVDFEQSLGHEQ